MDHLFTAFITFLTLFLFGLTILKIGVQQLSYKKMKSWVEKYTSSPFKGFIVGALTTGILQSSSTTIVITVTLTAAGILSFTNSIGIILGANVGTTVTGELLSFSSSWLMWICLLSGVMLLFAHKQLLFSIGCILFGIGTIFTALFGFESLAVPIQETPAFQNYFETISESAFFSVLFGTFITAIIQSSSAFTGMLMSFINEEIVTLSTALAMLLGANIGTCVTALLASIGGGIEGKRAALAHVWVNITGVICFIPFISVFSEFVMHLSEVPGRQLAHAAVLFNGAISFLFLPFVQPFARFMRWMYPARDRTEK
ncbi:MAG: Na/Pi cotransporter family protein [Bacillaceae bacterium]|nr:Na/Pi cotransporter family protein [Bacillaceae bacterium]